MACPCVLVFIQREYIEGDPAHSLLLFHLYLFNIPSYKLILIPQILMEKAREVQKNIYVCFIDYAKAIDCVDHNNRKFLK